MFGASRSTKYHRPVILKYIVILNNKKHTNPTFEKDLERFLANGVPMNTKQTAVMQFAITSDIVVQKSISTTSFILI